MPSGIAQQRVHHFVADHIPVRHRGLYDENPVRFRKVHAECANTRLDHSESHPGNVVKGDFAEGPLQLAATLQLVPDRSEHRLIEVLDAIRVLERLTGRDEVDASRENAGNARRCRDPTSQDSSQVFGHSE